jgi:hypothetical protein
MKLGLCPAPKIPESKIPASKIPASKIYLGRLNFEIETGPKTAFMSLSFRPSRLSKMKDKPEVVIFKLKAQDITLGKTLY